MRGIKFRAWDYIKERMMPQGSLYWDGEQFIVGIWNFEETHIVDEEAPVMLMQYTGLKDKNGVEIYEGDIVETDCKEIVYTKKPNVHGLGAKTKSVEKRGITICAWVNCGFKFSHINKSKHGFTTHNCEVIGNIYENPEILKDN